jgi:hypothetical protein
MFTYLSLVISHCQFNDRANSKIIYKSVAYDFFQNSTTKIKKSPQEKDHNEWFVH